jgi:superfamily II DNA or RNA helicase
MRLEERIYQTSAIEDVIRNLGKHKNVCLQLPTGAGKTVIFSQLAHRFYHKTGKRVLILVHREELMYQSQRTMEAMFQEQMSLIKAGTNWVKFTPAFIGMVESVSRRLDSIVAEDMNIGLVIVDEAHNASFNKIIRFFMKEYIIGVTATPLSSSKKEPMNKYYGTLVTGPSIKTLIKLNYLSQNITRAPKEVIDKAKLAIASTGDYDIQQMAEEFMKTKYVMSTYQAYKRFARNKKTIIFNVNVEHSKEVTEMFETFDYPCKHVDATTTEDERAKIFKWFHDTENAILCNVGIATLGFDEPTIECVIVNRATTSMPLWLQMCGRGSRYCSQEWCDENQYRYPYTLKPKVKFQIIDMGGNCITHGDWCDDRDWHYIFNNPELPKEGVTPMKECPKCGCFVHAATIICKMDLPETDELCGYIFDRKKYEEQQLYLDFVVVTEDPEIEKLLRNIKQGSYATFFEAAVKMIDRAEQSMIMDATKKNQLFELYFQFVKKWYVHAFPGRYFNENWHRELAKYNFNKYYEFRNQKRLEYEPANEKEKMEENSIA